MELQKALLALEAPARQINDAVNAIGIMVTGLSAEKDPYADGFNAVWNYLFDANQEFQKQVKICLGLI